jgi:hypothetical protein
MAIFAIRSAQNVNRDDSPQNSIQDTSKHNHATSRPTAVAPEPMIQFDDDMAHFVTHLDADPLAESSLKMHLVETFNDDSDMIREIPDEEEYTYARFIPI